MAQTDNSKALETLLTLANLFKNTRAAVRILDKATHEEWLQWYAGNPSRGVICDTFVSPFIGKTVQEMVQIVRQNHESTCINGRWFYMADQQTAFDSTLLLVEIPLHSPETPRTVRVFPALVNIEAENLIASRGGFQFLLDNVDINRVYRGYEYRINNNLSEQVNQGLAPVLRDMTRAETDIYVDDPVRGGIFKYKPSLNGLVDVYRGYVDQKQSYEPSECDTVTEDDLGDFVAEPEHDDSNMNVVDNVHVEPAEDNMLVFEDGHGAHNGELDGASTSDEGYEANDHVGPAEVDADQFFSDEGYVDNSLVGHVEHGELDDSDGGYVHSEHGDANDYDFSASAGGVPAFTNEDFTAYLATPDEDDEGNFDEEIDEGDIQTQLE